MRQRALFILLFLSSLSFIPALPSPLRIACGFLQTFYVPGFVFFLFFWDRRSPKLDGIFIPPLISPIVLSLLVAGVFAFTRSLGASVTISMLILYCLLLVALARRNRFGTPEDAERIPFNTVIVSLLFCGMIGTFYALNVYLLIRSDTFVHAPIVNEILDRGIPPLEPRLPDAPIRYPWFYHLFAACVVRLTGLSIFHALGLFNVMSAFVFPYVIAKIAAHYTKKSIHIVSAQIMAIAGLASASWILWPVVLLRALTGDVRGPEEVARILSQIDLNGSRVIFFLTPSYTLMVNPMDRFLTVSPFNHAIDLFLLCFVLVLSRDGQKKIRGRTAFSITFVIVGTFLMHVVSGVTLILTAVGASFITIGGRLLRKGERSSSFQGLVVPALALLAGVLCMPYFKSLTGGDGEKTLLRDYLYFGTGNLLTMIAPLVGLCFLVKPLLKYPFHDEPSERSMLSAWLIALFIINLFVDLPGQSELKFALLFLAFLGIPVSIVLVDWLASSGRTRRAFSLAWISILFLVPVFLTGRGFLLEKPATEAARKACMPNGDRMRLYEWIRAETPATSVIMELCDENYAPLYAHRHTFAQWSSLNSLLGYGAGTVDRNTAIRRELFSEEPLPAASVTYMRTIGYDIYVVVWTEDRTARPYLQDKFTALKPMLETVYDNPSGTVYHLNRAPAQSGH